jgi:hypothetical protein
MSAPVHFEGKTAVELGADAAIAPDAVDHRLAAAAHR